jgi:hypothetical protein
MQRYTFKYAWTALIYEIDEKGGETAVILGNLSAMTHLEKSAIMDGLRR